MTDPSEQLVVAADVVPEHAHALGFSLRSEETATYLAQRAGGIEGDALSRAPQTVAAATLYIAGVVHKERVSQAEISEETDVSVTAIQRCWPEVAAHQGVELDVDAPPAGQPIDALRQELRTLVPATFSVADARTDIA